MTTNELRQKRAALVAEMHDLMEKTTHTEESSARWAAADTEQEALRVQIEHFERTEKLDAEMRKVTAPPDQPAVNTGEQRVTNPISKAAELRGSDQYRKAFDHFVRTGQANSEIAELRTYAGLDNTSEPGGGDLVPISMQKEIERELKAYGGMRRNARIINTSTGNTLNWPTVSDVANKGRFLAVAGPVSQTNPSFNQVVFGSNLASSDQVLVAVQLMQDSAFPIEPLLNDLFGERLGRLLSDKYTSGNGTGEPKGLVPSITTNSLTAVGDSATGNTDLNSIGVNDFSDLISKLDPAYRPNAKFMANQSTFDFARKLKDTLGRPLWEVSIAQGVPDRIFGYEYDWNMSMDAIGAGKKSLIFGDFSHYVIRDVGGITAVRYNELYMPNHQVGFQAYLRTDGQCLQEKAFAVLVHPAS